MPLFAFPVDYACDGGKYFTAYHYGNYSIFYLSDGRTYSLPHYDKEAEGPNGHYALGENKSLCIRIKNNHASIVEGGLKTYSGCVGNSAY
eukprot:g66145.t1